MTQVAVGARLHFGFGNLSLSHSRLYGALGVALAEPQVSVTATPAESVDTPPPADGDWTVPPVAASHEIPDDWRFLLVIPDSEPGRSGDAEDDSIRAAIERAEPARADRIAGLLTRRVLPAIAAGDANRFGAAVAEIGRLNGAWYTDEQGGIYRPPVGELVESLSGSPAVYGAGQSSWGPTVYGVTDVAHADVAREAGHDALAAAGIDGDVRLVAGRNHGARIDGEAIDVTAKRP